MKNYSQFLKTKRNLFKGNAIKVKVSSLNKKMFIWQRVLVRWALRKGKVALFEECGLGKTIQQLEWARIICEKTGGNVIIFCPLAVAAQTKKEGEKFSYGNIKYNVNICRERSDIKPGINITNYERLDKFEASDFAGIVLDESSIIKSFAGKIRNKIIEKFSDLPYKLCCTATPAPNDFTELGNTAEFLGIMRRAEMLSMFFINDTSKVGTWRLKGHVVDNVFWEWLCSWSVMIRKPSDIGFSDKKFILPKLNVKEIRTKAEAPPKYKLFIEPVRTLSERREVRKKTIEKRTDVAAEYVNNSDDVWLVWCDLNNEAEVLRKKIDNSVEVKGPDDISFKESTAIDFAAGKIKCLVTKPKIFKFGMNWQNCNNMFFIGLSDSWESYYQTVRRVWRFGQKKEVNVYIVIDEREESVIDNVKRKQRDFDHMFNNMAIHMRDIMKQNISVDRNKRYEYRPLKRIKLPDFLKGDR